MVVCASTSRHRSITSTRRRISATPTRRRSDDVLVRNHRQRGQDTFFSRASTSTRRRSGGSPRSKASSRRSTPTRSPCRGGSLRRTMNAVGRLLHPHERRGPQALRPRLPPADVRQRRHLRGRLRGLVLRRLRGVQDRGGADRRTGSARPPDEAGVDRGEELLLPALRVPGQAARALRRAARLRAARASASTRRGRSSRAGSRTSASRARASRGASRCPGTRARSRTSGPTR